MLGDPVALAGAIALVLLASLGIGLLIAVISDSERQAVQLSLLLLLASVFFSGFVLAISEFSEPVRALAYLLPVTHGIRLMQDIMLRGGTTQTWRFAALVADRRGDPGVELARPAPGDDPCVTDRGRQAITDPPTRSTRGSSMGWRPADRATEARPRRHRRLRENAEPNTSERITLIEFLWDGTDGCAAGDPRFPRVAAVSGR